MKKVLLAVTGTAMTIACSGNDGPGGAMSATRAQVGSPSVRTSYTFTLAPVQSAALPDKTTTETEQGPSRGANAPSLAVPEYREVTLPAGMVLALRLTSTVASDSSEIEDAVGAALREDVMVDGHLIVPAGAELRGRVVDVDRSGRIKGLARVAFQFTTLEHDGDEYNLSTEAIERYAEATKGEDATKIGLGAGTGAVVGAILDGGTGAVKGAAIGAAAATGAVLVTRGAEVKLEPGEVVDTRLTAAVPVRVRAY